MEVHIWCLSTPPIVETSKRKPSILSKILSQPLTLFIAVFMLLSLLPYNLVTHYYPVTVVYYEYDYIHIR